MVQPANRQHGRSERAEDAYSGHRGRGAEARRRHTGQSAAVGNLYRAADRQHRRYYYYPGWQEPGPTLECIINRDAWDSLPEDLQAIVRVACQATTLDMVSEFMARNATSLAQLQSDENVELRKFPDDVLAGLKALSRTVVDELAVDDPVFARVWASCQEFMAVSQPWQAISEQAYLQTQTLS